MPIIILIIPLFFILYNFSISSYNVLVILSTALYFLLYLKIKNDKIHYLTFILIFLGLFFEIKVSIILSFYLIFMNEKLSYLTILVFIYSNCLVLGLLGFLLKYIVKYYNINNKYQNFILKNDIKVNLFSVIYKENENQVLLKQREKIAEKLHNSVGHKLVNLLFYTNHLENGNLTSIIKDTIKDTRDIIHGLSFYKEDYKKMIFRIINESKYFYNVHEFIDDDLFDLNIVYLEVIYNLIQENITNTMKHSDAQNIYLNVYLKDDLIFEFKNDFCKNVVSHGIGESNLKQNVLNLNGKMKIEKDDFFKMKVVIKID